MERNHDVQSHTRRTFIVREAAQFAVVVGTAMTIITHDFSGFVWSADDVSSVILRWIVYFFPGFATGLLFGYVMWKVFRST